jgi:PAS domain S-box-containing protein
MRTGLRKTGIDAVGELPWGTHFCHFYATKEDLIDILIPYFKAGLESRELCMWVVFDPLKEEDAIAALRAAVPGADRHLETGDIEILPYSQWYLKDGTFDVRRVIHGWKEKLARALANGYDGMRVNGNEAWLTEKDWKEFSAYEKELNEMIAGQRILVLCTYPLEATKAAELYDVARTHQFAIAKRHGIWEVVETPELSRAKSEIQGLNEELTRKIFEQTRELAAINEDLRREINVRTRAEEALKESEGELRTLFAAMTDVVMVLGAEGHYVKIAPTNPLNLYAPSEELLGKKIHEVLPKEDADLILQQIGKALETRETIRFEYKLNIGPREVWFDGRISRLTDTTVFWIAHDITERKQAEEDLRKQKEILQTIFDHLPVMINFIGQDGRIRLINREWERTLGWSLEEIQRKNLDILAECYPDPQVHREVLEFIATTNAQWGGFRTRVKDGRVIDTMWAMVHLSDGTAIGIGQDVTGRKLLEEQFLQAQKMEAVGQLAGGIAHDLNNLLTAISGYGELAMAKLHAGDPLRHDIEEIRKAGGRAASLTRQLLAFSRKQILQPVVFNLNSVVSEMEKMLRRIIGEHIEMRIALEPGLGNVKADPGQIGQVLMNLAVNARDAMPKGGRLTIETRNVHLDEEYARRHIAVRPGPYVMLEVTDTGTGMDEQTQKRIFDPFFTTKEVGKGTGLGLSTVYGIVKQSGGNIWVFSEVGKGTAFKIYLPHVEESIPARKPGREPKEALEGSETILLAEDEEMLRTLVSRVLQGYGYQVLEAANGPAALRICEGHREPIHLLLTDAIMPGMSGRELAQRVALLRPETKVLYMSGYADDVISHHGILDADIPFLEKPFTPDVLARKVREVLEAARK